MPPNRTNKTKKTPGREDPSSPSSQSYPGFIPPPRESRKIIDHRAMPNSKRTFPNRKAGTVMNDTVEFYGAKLNVEVLNPHRSTSRWLRGRDWTIAADGLVRLEEGGIQIRFDSHFVGVKLRKHQRGDMPPYTHFVWELPRKFLKEFPVMLEFDQRRRFTGLVIFKPKSKTSRGRKS